MKSIHVGFCTLCCRVGVFTLTVMLLIPMTAVAQALPSVSAAACERLSSFQLAGTTITKAQVHPAGVFTLPGPPPANPNPALRNVPIFCRVEATLKPTADSDIKIEVWLPLQNWNGKLQSVGNGAWGGAVPYGAMAAAIVAGYATAATDTGHVGNTPSFAVGHPEKLADYGYRAVHEMTVTAKSVVSAFYGNAPKRSYWNACSTGGRQGLMEAQRYPSDYDGIIAGAPVAYREEQLVWHIWAAQAVNNEEASYIPPEKYPLIHQAALNACDARDGQSDGLIDRPEQCSVDVQALQCNGADGPSCLTQAQVRAAEKLYSPLLNPRTGQQIYPGLLPGSELGWAGVAGRQPRAEAEDFFKYLVFGDPKWDFRTLNFETALAAASQADRGFVNATEPNLTSFFNRNGKLLMYHGWTDQLVAPMSSVNYYNDVVKATGGLAKAADSIRLFMMPGMNHCAGGEGPDTFDKIGILDRWVEQGQAPDQIEATHLTNGQVDRRRLLCPYPQVAKYKGSGSSDVTNFRCELP